MMASLYRVMGSSKKVDAKNVAKVYPRGKADLYVAFLERGLQSVKDGGMSALLRMRGWMFHQQFTDLPVYEAPPAINFISYAIGIALSHFAVTGEGILTPTPHLPHSILYLSPYSERDSLEHPITQHLNYNRVLKI